MVQFYLLPCPPPRAYPRGFAILFSLGGLFPTPGQAERDNSPPPGLLIDHKYVVLCTKHSKSRRFDKNLNAFLEILEQRTLHV